MDWMLPTNEILAKVEKMAAEERKAAELKPAAVTIGNGKTVRTAQKPPAFRVATTQAGLSFQATF